MADLTTYFAFDTLRTTQNTYAYASKASDGTVRFHGSYEAARRYGRVNEARIATDEDRAAVKAAKRRFDAERTERAEEFDRRMEAAAGAAAARNRLAISGRRA